MRPSESAAGPAKPGEPENADSPMDAKTQSTPDTTTGPDEGIEATGRAEPAGTAEPSDPGAGPASVLTCPECGKKNRIRPNEHGTPHCGSCGKALPWVVDALDSTFALEAKSSVAVLVDLWAPWCGPCRYVSPMLEELARDYAGRLKVVKVNVDQNPQVASAFDARSIPTLVVIRDGRMVDRVVGAMPKSDLTARLMPYLLRRQ
jgi:thioredoxin 2